MGIWSKLKKAVAIAVEVAPSLPIPDKAKKITADVGKVESDVEALVQDVHPPKPAA
jgi:hypothetical protein